MRVVIRQVPEGPEADQLRSEMRTYSEHYDAIERAWDSLVADHDGEWVASYAGEFAFGNTLDDVLAAATSREWDLRLTALKFLELNPPPMLR